VSTETQATQLILASMLLLRLGLSDDHLLYVQSAMRPWIVAGALVLVAINAAYVLARWTRGRADAGDAGADVSGVDAWPGHPDHRDHRAGAIGWLLALPVAVVVVVPMQPLGSYAAARHPARLPPAPPLSGSDFPPLPAPVDGAVELTLGGFVTLALDDPDRRLEDQVVRLTGFVTSPDDAGGGVRLTRFALSCCAADAFATSVALHGLTVPPPPDDTWMTVEGTWTPDPSGDEPDAPALEVSAVRQIPAPADPYEP
jgi:uncharacterized repeat protein (TIGR03943 family)